MKKVPSTYISTDGQLVVQCIHLFIGESERVVDDPKNDEGTILVPLSTGVPQCSVYYDKPELLGDVPSWFERSGMNSYPIQFPKDCRNCPLYKPDPIKQKLLDRKQNGNA